MKDDEGCAMKGGRKKDDEGVRERRRWEKGK
jgi:hypothetical protein